MLKRKIVQKRVIALVLAMVLLAAMSFMMVSARYGMGGANVYNGSIKLAEGYAWNNNVQTTNYTMNAETSKVHSSIVVVTAKTAIIYRDSSIGPDSITKWSDENHGNSYISASVSIGVESWIIPLGGAGYYAAIDGSARYANNSTHSWIWG